MGNGDVFCPADAERMFRETGVDGVMMGRGVLANPWLIRQCFDYLNGNKVVPVSLAEKADFLVQFMLRITRETPPPLALGKMKKMGGYLSKGIPHGATLRGRMHEARTAEEFLESTRAFFAHLLPQTA